MVSNKVQLPNAGADFAEQKTRPPRNQMDKGRGRQLFEGEKKKKAIAPLPHKGTLEVHPDSRKWTARYAIVGRID